MRSGDQGGSQTSATLTFDTPGIPRIRSCASAASAGPIPHPGAVNVICTSTFFPPSGAGRNREVVDQPEIHDVYGNLRIVTVAQLFPDFLFGEACRAAVIALRLFRRRTLILAERVGVGAVDSKKTAGSRCDDREGSAQRLGDHHGGAGFQFDDVAARDLRRLHITRERLLVSVAHKMTSEITAVLSTAFRVRD
jgi:hypothetical protein